MTKSSIDLNFGKNSYKGTFVVFEGIDGSGKSTVSKYVLDRLKKENYYVNRFFEPTDISSYGRHIRRNFADGLRLSCGEEISLFLLDREFNKRCNLEPTLKTGGIVLLDRYFYSTMAYQGHKIDPQFIFDINAPVLISPDLVLMFDVDVDVALERIRLGREEGFTSTEQKDNLLRVQKIYRSMKADNITIIDSDKKIESVCEDAYKQVLKTLRSKHKWIQS